VSDELLASLQTDATLRGSICAELSEVRNGAYGSHFIGHKQMRQWVWPWSTDPEGSRDSSLEHVPVRVFVFCFCFCLCFCLFFTATAHCLTVSTDSRGVSKPLHAAGTGPCPCLQRALKPTHKGHCLTVLLSKRFPTLQARAGKSVWEYVYDIMVHPEAPHGGVLVRPLYNYGEHSMEPLRELFQHERVVAGFADGGAHGKLQNESTTPTTMLTCAVPQFIPFGACPTCVLRAVDAPNGCRLSTLQLCARRSDRRTCARVSCTGSGAATGHVARNCPSSSSSASKRGTRPA
jgi:hypothetical protein